MPRALLLATLLALPLAAEDPAFKVQGGLNGHVREDRWTYVRIDAQGADEDFEGIAVLSSQAWDGSEAETILPLQVPRQSRKRFEVYHRAQGSTMLSLKVINAEGSKTYDEPLESAPADARWLVAVLGPSLGGLEGYGQVGSQDLAVLGLRVEDLPRKSWGLDAVDWLVWPEPDPQQLLPEQMESVVEWVRAGGHLCLCVAKGVDIVNASPLAPLLPGKLERADEMDDFEALEKLAKVRLPRREPTLVARIQPSGKVVLAQDGRPLAVRRRFGLGEVLLLPFDPLNGPFARWTGREPMWLALLGLPKPQAQQSTMPKDDDWNDYLAEQPESPPATQVWVQRMESAPLGKMVDADVFILLFVAYVAVVGIGDYIFWKRRKKSLGLWWATPVWVVLFGFLGWRAGTAGRREKDLLRAVTVYDQCLGDKGWVYHGGVTLYVGSGQRLSVVPSPAPGVLWPTADRREGRSLARPKTRVVQTPQGTEARDLKMYSASMLSFLTEGRGVVPDLSGLSVTVADGRVVVENKTAIAWEDGWLLGPSRCVHVGNLFPGGSRMLDPSSREAMTDEEAGIAARNTFGFPADPPVYGYRRSYYYEQRTDFGDRNAHVQAMQLLLEPWGANRRFDQRPGGIVPRDLREPCLLLVANGGPGGVAIDGFQGERVTGTAVRIWLGEETLK